jgi:hypothetical protein
VVDVGPYTGGALGAQVGVSGLGLRASAGWNPLLVSTTAPDTLRTSSLHVFSTGQVNVDAFALPFRSASGALVGGSAGYKYNSVLGHGASVAFDAQLVRSRRVRWHFQAGVVYYPDGTERVSAERAIPQGDHISFPFGARWQAGASIGLAVYP